MTAVPSEKTFAHEESSERRDATTLDRSSTEREFELRRLVAEQELALKREDLALRKQDARKAVWSSPLLIAVIGLIATVLANGLQSWYQGQATRELERQRFESALVQKAVETNDSKAAAARLKFLLALRLIEDKQGSIAAYVAKPETIPLQPTDGAAADDTYRELERRTAKLSIGSRTLETFAKFGAFTASLPEGPEEEGIAETIGRGADSARTPHEQRNVRLAGFLVAASRDQTNDFNLVICDSGDKPTECVLAVVSGLPSVDTPSYEPLKGAREAFKQFFGKDIPGFTYDFYDPPIPVDVQGSLLYEPRGRSSGPQTFHEQLLTSWHIRPVTRLAFR